MEVSVPVENENGTVKFDVTLNAEQHQALLKYGMSMALAMGLAAHLLGEDIAMLLEDNNEELDD